MEKGPLEFPLPLEPLPSGPKDDRRLWIGNLDPRVREFTLLKLLQSYGAIEKFDLLFHRAGPQIGQPRGYAFVTYSNPAHAANALKGLNGKLIGSNKVALRYAHSVSNSDLEKQKPEISIPALVCGGKKSDGSASSTSKIQEIEAKLKMMQKASTEFNLTATTPQQGSSKNVPKVVPGVVLYKQQQKNTSNEKRSAPYSRHDKRRHRK